MANNITVQKDQPATLVGRMAERFGVEASKMLTTLKATAFRSETEVTNEQMMALLVVAEQYGLNPWTKEIYAFPDKNKGIIPVVGIDGWSRIINSNPQFDGMEFIESDEVIASENGEHKPCPAWIECVIYRKDRRHPIKVRERFAECYRPPFTGRGKNGPYTVSGPWQSHTARFLRHKAMIQCARVAFGFVGIFDQDEAERIAEANASRGSLPAPEQGDQSKRPKRTAKAALNEFAGTNGGAVIEHQSDAETAGDELPELEDYGVTEEENYGSATEG